MRTNRFLLAGLLPALLLAGFAAAQNVPLDVEIGYRFSDVSGNEEMFKSMLDERAGLQLRSLTWGLGDIRDSKAIDHFRIDAADLGVGPNGLLRVEAGRTGYWKLNASWRRAERYSNLPTIANPFLEKGTLDSQHSFDRTRNSVDVDLELLPGKAIRPLLGFSYSRYAGPGLTTYHVGQDDFRLDQDLKEKETEYRIGVAFDAGPVTGQVIQGWRNFRGEETLVLSPGAGAGNNNDPILGVSPSLSSLTRTSKTDIDTPVTSAVVAGTLGPVRLTGTYVRAKADGDDSESENLAGNLVSYQILRYFKGLAETSTASTDALSWRGSIRADVHVTSGFDVSAGFTRRNRELDGYGLVNDLYGTTTTFTGFDPKDVATILQSRTRLERDEDIFDLRASFKLAEPLSLRLGLINNDSDIDVQNDPSEVVAITGGQGGRYNRRTLAVDGGLTFHLKGVTLGVEFTRQTADNAVMRTDFNERERLRARGIWEPTAWLRIGATAETVDTSNDDPGYGLDGKTKTYAGDLEVSPLKWLRVRVGAGRFEGDNTIGYRQPQDWVDATSVYRERGNSFEGGISLDLKPFTLEALLRRFENDGSFPYDLNRARVRADYEFSKLVGIVGEWDLDDYTEKGRSYGSGADFKANRYGLFLRIHP